MTHSHRTRGLSALLALIFAIPVGANLITAQAQSTADQSGQAGRAVKPGANVRGQRRMGPAGPAWIKGQDGAQNTRKLKHQMKVQNRRMMHQYDQAQLQVREQQQQEYEKAMLPALASQRPKIQQNRQDIKHLRQETGANQ
jgi:hypothetical protein